MKTIILRGLPGAGKSTLAKKYEGATICSSDSYFTNEKNEYVYDESKIAKAYEECLKKFIESVLEKKSLIVVDDTNLMLWEVMKYIDIAKAYGYETTVVEVKCSAKFSFERNHKGIPLKVIEDMVCKYEKLPSHITSEIVDTGNTLIAKVYIDYDFDIDFFIGDYSFGKLITYHSNIAHFFNEVVDVEEIKEIIADENYYHLPIYVYNHSNYSFSTNPYNCRWDSGLAGIICIEKNSEYIKDMSKEEVIRMLKNKVDDLDNIAKGEVYRYEILDSFNDVIDSCSYFIGYNCIKESIEYDYPKIEIKKD